MCSEALPSLTQCASVWRKRSSTPCTLKWVYFSITSLESPHGLKRGRICWIGRVNLNSASQILIFRSTSNNQLMFSRFQNHEGWNLPVASRAHLITGEVSVLSVESSTLGVLISVDAIEQRPHSSSTKMVGGTYLEECLPSGDIYPFY